MTTIERGVWLCERCDWPMEQIDGELVCRSCDPDVWMRLINER